MDINILGRNFGIFSNKMQIEKALGILEHYFIRPEMLALLITFVTYFEF